MFFLNKMFKLRDKANPEEEKPFLDHLEDLRIAITRIALTLVAATMACFVFKDTLMEIIRKPVEEVWVSGHEETLPEELDITFEDWEAALSYAEVAPQLANYNEEYSEKWWSEIDDDKLRRLTEAAIVYRAARKLPADSQESFIELLPDEQSETRKMALLLLEGEPAETLNRAGNLRLMSSLKPTETFMLTMKLAFFAGLVVSFPFILYFILQFILPGLKPEERKALWPALLIGFGLFLGGVLFAYFIVLPNVLTFFYEWGKGMGISNDWRIGYYISFATTFVLIFGLAFELPVVVMTFVKLGLLSHTMMRETRSYAILAILVIAALITPTPDAATLSFLAVPMIFFYEICIWLSYFHEKKVKREEAEEESQRMKRLLSDPDAESEESDSESDLDDTEEGEEEDISDHEDDSHEEEEDDYHAYPGEHQNPEEDYTYDPLADDPAITDLPEDETKDDHPDKDDSDDEKDRK